MAVVSIAALKAKFETGDFPTEQDFTDLIDTLSSLPASSSGSYTPTLTNVANITSSTARVSQWSKVGDTLTVSGGFNATLSATGPTTIYISLPPISGLISTFVNASRLGGVGAFISGYDFIGIVGNNDGSGNPVADCRWNSSLTGAREYTFHFTFYNV